MFIIPVNVFHARFSATDENVMECVSEASLNKQKKSPNSHQISEQSYFVSKCFYNQERSHRLSLYSCHNVRLTHKLTLCRIIKDVLKSSGFISTLCAVSQSLFHTPPYINSNFQHQYCSWLHTNTHTKSTSGHLLTA